MLAHCAPGYAAKASKHNWRVTFGTACFPSLPLGPHGDRTNPSIEIGHVKQMARTLGILDCAKTFLKLK